MKRSLFILGLLVFCLLTISYAQETTSVELSQVKVCGQDIAGLRKLALAKNDLVNGQVNITGEVSSALGIAKVLVSTNGGAQYWDVIPKENSWELLFTPENEAEYIVIVMAVDTAGNVSRPWGVSVSFRSLNNEEMIKDVFDGLVWSYNNKNPDKLMSYFSQSQCPDFAVIQETAQTDFDRLQELNLSVIVAKVEITEAIALVQADWSRAWVLELPDTFPQEGSASGHITVTLQKAGSWQIASLSDLSMFVAETTAENLPEPEQEQSQDE